MTKVQKTNLLRIVSYIASVSMFLQIHRNPGVPEGPTNMLFLWDLLLDNREKDDILVDQSLKKVFIKHFTFWINPVNVALNVYSHKPAHHAKHLEDPHQNLFDKVDIQQLAWMRVPLKSYFTSHRKVAPCLVEPNKNFENLVDNHNRSCEWFIGRMSHWLTDRKVRDFKTFEEKDRSESKILGYINYGSKE